MREEVVVSLILYLYRCRSGLDLFLEYLGFKDFKDYWCDDLYKKYKNLRKEKKVGT